MNLKSRIEKLENKMMGNVFGYAWDFSKTTDEQLEKLCHLYETNLPEGERFAQELIDSGYLSHPLLEAKR